MRAVKTHLHRYHRRYALPSLLTHLLNATTPNSTSRQHQSKRLTDLCFNSPLGLMHMPKWESFDKILCQSRAHATTLLGVLPPTTQQGYVDQPPARPAPKGA